MKGQESFIDYLMTYGWAILIVAIVAGVLSYFGIFAPLGFRAPICDNCYNRTGNCFIHNCTCEDNTNWINPDMTCDHENPHYVIP